MKLTLKAPKPRNPLVAPSRRRHAGAHRVGAGGMRQRAGRALRAEIDRLFAGP